MFTIAKKSALHRVISRAPAPIYLSVKLLLDPMNLFCFDVHNKYYITNNIIIRSFV